LFSIVYRKRLHPVLIFYADEI